MSNDCGALHEILNEGLRFQYPFDTTDMPLNGLYVLFEDGEEGHGRNRIVRVGTHTGPCRLQKRLSDHFIKEYKDRSIFRKNIGRAILSQMHDPFLHLWEQDRTTRMARQEPLNPDDTHRLRAVESMVSAVLRQRFSFVLIRAEEKETRLQWESQLIATVSLCSGCEPSPQWLGQYSPVPNIRDSGLWLIKGLYGQPLNHEDLTQIDQHLVR